MLIGYRQAGVTLPELIVTLLVVAILAAVAVPNLAGMIATNKLNDAQEQVLDTFKMAHTTAVANGTFATVTITAVARTLNTTYSNGVPSSTVTLNSEVVPNADAIYRFSPNGTVDHAGTVTLTSANHPALAGRGISISITGLITATR